MADDSADKSKVTLRLFGKPGQAYKAAGGNVLLGHILGVIDAVKIKSDSRGETFEVLTGSFEAFVVAGKETVRAPVLALPAAFHKGLADCARSAGSAQFVYEVHAVKNGDLPAMLAFKPVLSPRGRPDPLEALRDVLVNARNLPAEAPASPAAPVDASHKPGRKAA